MLITTPLEAFDGVLDGNAQERDEWFGFSTPGSAAFDFKYMMVGLGDPVSGPRITILYCEPSEPGSPGTFIDPSSSDWDEGEKRGVHYHRTDQWRFQLAEGQHFFIGKERYYFGDFYLQPACTWYFDPMGPSGMTMFQTDADRRGSIGCTRENRELRGDAWLATVPDPSVVMTKAGTAFDEDSKATRGAAISTGAKIPKAGLKGSFFDTDEWTALADGSRVCAIFEGDPVSGPLILLSQNAPGVVEAPAGTYGSDHMRVILTGSCSVGGRTLGHQDYRAVEAGVSETEVVHGEEGSVQMLYFADRREWRSSGAGEADVRASEIAALLESASPRGEALIDA
jgi:hypothetical protein